MITVGYDLKQYMSQKEVQVLSKVPYKVAALRRARKYEDRKREQIQELARQLNEGYATLTTKK